MSHDPTFYMSHDPTNSVVARKDNY